MQYNFQYENLNRQDIIGADVVAQWRIADGIRVDASYTHAHVSPYHGLELSTTAKNSASASATAKRSVGKHDLTAVLTTAIMGRREYDVQDRLRINERNGSTTAYFSCRLPAYAIANLSLTDEFGGWLRVQVGVENLTNYKPEILGAGLTMFNVPATPGRRLNAQIEISLQRQ